MVSYVCVLILRKLNEITIRDSYPMPLTTVIFNKTPGHKYYSKLDLKLLTSKFESCQVMNTKQLLYVA